MFDFYFFCVQIAFEQTNGIQEHSTEADTKNDETEIIDVTTVENNPKYLEILSNDNEDEPISSAYEKPLDLNEQSSFSSSSNNITQNENESTLNLELRNQGEPLKERTLSSSSTVSEASMYYPKIQTQSQQMDNNDSLAPDVILKVVLPNTKEDCTSNEKLLMQKQLQCPSVEKIRQFCNDSNNIENVLSYDGITSM